MLSSKREFHMEEYKQIRSEAVELITKTELLLQYTAVITAGVFSWLSKTALGQQPENGRFCTKLTGSLTILWWIPCVAVVVVGLLSGVRFLRIKEMGEYLKKLEDSMGDVRFGWQKFLEKKPSTVFVVTVLAWIVMLFATGYAAIFMQNTDQPNKTAGYIEMLIQKNVQKIPICKIKNGSINTEEK